MVSKKMRENVVLEQKGKDVVITFSGDSPMTSKDVKEMQAVMEAMTAEDIEAMSQNKDAADGDIQSRPTYTENVELVAIRQELLQAIVYAAEDTEEQTYEKRVIEACFKNLLACASSEHKADAYTALRLLRMQYLCMLDNQALKVIEECKKRSLDMPETFELVTDTLPAGMTFDRLYYPALPDKDE